MFQTDLHHFLQSFASEPLTLFMRSVTALGYVEFFMIFIFTLLLAVNFKKGFILFLVLLWTTLITFIGKDYFDLPRPFHVDNNLAFLDGQLPDETNFNFSDRGAQGFWDPLPVDVLLITRAADGLENGFPSGHSSIAIAFWGALMLLYRNKWISILGVSLMILIPLSRLYLGVHFVADIIGGITIGGLMLLGFYFILLKPEILARFLARDKYKIGINKISFLLLIAPLPFLLILPPRVAIIIPMMVSLGLAFLLLSRKGLPIDDGTVFQRSGRLLLSIGAATLVGFLLNLISKSVGLDSYSSTLSITLFISVAILIWVGVEVSIRMGMYKRI